MSLSVSLKLALRRSLESRVDNRIGFIDVG